MKRNLLGCCLGLSLLGVVLRLPAEVTIRRSAQTSQTDRIEFAPGGTIRLNDSFGDLFIEGWNEPAIETTLIREMSDYDTPKDVAERLQRVRFTTDRSSPTELTISTVVPSHSFFRHPFGGKGPVTVRYELHVPRNTNLVIEHGGGNILIDNITGGIDAHNRNGDIVLMLPGQGQYDIDARSKMGTVNSEFPGTPRVQHFIGEKFTGGGNAHSIRLRVGFGGITIKEMIP